MNKPELLCTAANLDELIRLIDAGVDAVNIGHERFGLRIPGNFSLEEMEKAVHVAHEKGVKVYVSVNALFHNKDLDEVESYLGFLSGIGADAIVFGDPAVLFLARKIARNVALHWNPETLCTNVETINFWGEKGVKRAYLARELNMDSILEIKEEAQVEIQVQVYGATCIFQSRRDLVSSYQIFIGDSSQKTGQDEGLLLKEEKRQDLFYPIYEDRNGTNILSSEDVCILEHLDELMDGNIDSFKIEGILKTTDQLVQVVSIFRQAIDLYMADPGLFSSRRREWMEKLGGLQPAHRPLTTGFYFKEQVF